MVAFQVGVLEPFVKFVNTSGPEVNRNVGSSLVNRVAMMAHLVVSPLATELWEKLHADVSEADTPAMLDSMEGRAGIKKDIGLRLLSVAVQLAKDKDQLDLSV